MPLCYWCLKSKCECPDEPLYEKMDSDEFDVAISEQWLRISDEIERLRNALEDYRDRDYWEILYMEPHFYQAWCGPFIKNPWMIADLALKGKDINEQQTR